MSGKYIGFRRKTKTGTKTAAERTHKYKRFLTVDDTTRRAKTAKFLVFPAVNNMTVARVPESTRSWRGHAQCETYPIAVTAFIKNPSVKPRSSQSSPPEPVGPAVTRGHRRSTRGQHDTTPAGVHGFRSFFLYGEVLKLSSCYMKSRRTPPSQRRQSKCPTGQEVRKSRRTFSKSSKVLDIFSPAGGRSSKTSADMEVQQNFCAASTCFKKADI